MLSHKGIARVFNSEEAAHDAVVNNEINKVIENGERYIKKLQEYSVVIKDKAILKDIDNMKHIVAMIFYEIDANENMVQCLGQYL